MTVAPAPAPEAAGPSLRLTEQDEGTMPGLGAHEGIGFNTSPPSRVLASEDPQSDLHVAAHAGVIKFAAAATTVARG